MQVGSDAAGTRSRRLGGIHFSDGGLRGRHMGKKIGQQAWALARGSIEGRVRR